MADARTYLGKSSMPALPLCTGCQHVPFIHDARGCHAASGCDCKRPNGGDA